MYLENLEGVKLILGSASPRRQYLLKKLNFEFEVRTLDFDERSPTESDVRQHPEIIANRKSLELGSLNENELLICSDTSVILDHLILNKPADREEALDMLKQLRGQWHEVITGVSLRQGDRIHSFSECTRVHFKALNDPLLEHYVDTHQPFDKAGAYGIQEWFGYVAVDKIEGCFYNVMGLPVSRLYEEMICFAEIPL